MSTRRGSLPQHLLESVSTSCRRRRRLASLLLSQPPTNMPCPAERLIASGDAPKPLRDVLTRARGAWLRNEHVVDILRNHRAYNFPVSRAPPLAPASGCLFLFNRRATRYFRRDGHSWRTKADGKTVRETHEKLKVDGKDALNCYYAHTVPGSGSGNENGNRGNGNGNGSGRGASNNNNNGDNNANDGSDSDAATTTTTATLSQAAAAAPRAAPTAAVEGLQRRCYWLLQGDEGLVLVHYLAVAPPPSALRASQALSSAAIAAAAAGLRSSSPLSASAAALCRAASAPVFSGRGGGGGAGARAGGNGGNDSDNTTAATTTATNDGLLQLHMLLPEGVSHESGPRGVTVTTGGALKTLGRSVGGGASGGGGGEFFFLLFFHITRGRGHRIRKNLIRPLSKNKEDTPETGGTEAVAATEAVLAAAAGNATRPSPFAATPSENARPPVPSPSSAPDLPSAFGGLERAATAPAAGLAWQRHGGALLLSPSFSGFFAQLNLSIGPLHRAPSRSGSTVQTGETLDAAAAAAAVAAIAADAAVRRSVITAGGGDATGDEIAAVSAAVAAEFGEGREEEAPERRLRLEDKSSSSSCKTTVTLPPRRRK